MQEQTTIDTPLVDTIPLDNQEVDTQDSVEEAIFGGNEQDSIWAPQEPRPLAAPDENSETQETQQPAEEKPVDNDTTRYQYWQSEADKMKNTLAEMQKQNDELKNQLIGQYQNQQIPQQAQPEPVEEVDEFPSAPDKPQKPRGFSRVEANEDPNSESVSYTHLTLPTILRV